MMIAATVVVSPGGASPATAAATDYLEESFSAQPSDWTDGWHDAAIGSRNRFTRISDGADGSAVRVNMPAGSHFGSAAHWRFAEHGHAEPQQLYFRYYLHFPTGYVNEDPGQGKLPGVAGLYSGSARNNIKPTNSQPGWSARLYFTPPAAARAADHTRIGFYVYHRDQAASHGDLLLWDSAPADLRHGSWYCIEGHVAMNAPGVANGVLTGWVDEKLAFYQDDFQFLGGGDGGRGVKSFWMDTYYGGTEPSPTSLNVDFDSLELSSERIGCSGGGPGSFGDIGSSVHKGDIARLAHSGITRGCNPPANDLFCPTKPVTRGQMAAFLGRGLGLPASAADPFTDDDGSVFEADIAALEASGITRGCGPGQFCPDSKVTRGQMAAFLDRALGLDPTATDYFTDDDDSMFEGSINRLAAAGITSGCNPPANDRYCPNNVVTREQMATFLSRALGLPAPPSVPDGPTPVTPPPGFDVEVPAGASIQATVNSMPGGARIHLGPGTHPRQTVVPKPGQELVGDAGATILDGENELAHAFVSTGVGAVANVRIAGVEIENYDPANNQGAVHTDGTGWIVEDCEIHDTGNVGVVVGDDGVIRNCHIHHNDQTGILLDAAARVLVDGNEINDNGPATDPGSNFIGDAGAVFRDTTDLEVRNNHVHDNHGHGLWSHYGTDGTTYDSNVVEDNYRSGIFHNRSGAATITNNQLRRNGSHSPATSSIKGAGIWVGGPDVEISGNTVEDNVNGIVFWRENPADAPIRNGDVHHNVIIDSGNSGARTDGDAGMLSSLSFDWNDYHYGDIADRWWYWDGLKTWAQWQGAGNDPAGTLQAS